MVTENAAVPAASAAAKPDQNSLICYFQGGYVALGDAHVSIMTHAFLYGTADFEGIRAYWNPEDKQLYALRVQEHRRGPVPREEPAEIVQDRSGRPGEGAVDVEQRIEVKVEGRSLVKTAHARACPRTVDDVALSDSRHRIAHGPRPGI